MLDAILNATLPAALDPGDWALLALAAFVAGFIDAVGGGGGLVQVPALFGVLPGVPPATLLGTNKLAAAFGTGGAAWRYAREYPVPWRITAPAALAALVASALGAWIVTQVPADTLRKAVPFLLAGVLAWTLIDRTLGVVQVQRALRRQQQVAAGGAGAIGFYDGLFGPGAGTFYKLLFTRGVGFDFLNAAAPSKIANVGSNLGALLLFVVGGHVMWLIGGWMLLFNVVGGQFGARVGLRHGNALIRRAFIAVVLLLVLKTFHDAWL